MNTETFGHPDARHPYTNFRLSDAVRIANNLRSLSFLPPVTSLAEARSVLQESSARTGHVWITGAAALDVLDAAVVGRDLIADNRIV